MNLKKTDLKSKLSAVKHNAKKKGTAAKKRKNAPFHGYSKPNNNGGSVPRREGKLVVPIGFQTVLAVIVCCSVLVVAGLGFYGAQQMEIQNLKNELKAYVADGLVPAGSMDASVTLNIEAVGGRVANLQKMMDQAVNGKLTNEELLWIGTELNAVHAESQILNDVLNEIEADKNLRNAYADKIQSPIVVIQESYSTLSASANLPGEDSNGAAANTGAFKSSGNMEKSIRWIMVIVVVVALLVTAFLLRRKLSAMLFRHHNNEEKAATAKKTVSHKHGTSKKSTETAAKFKGKATHEHPFADEKEEDVSAPVVTAESSAEEEAEAGAELSEEEAFLANVDALRKMAESERKKAEEGSAMIAPLAEDLMTFDADVTKQSEIEDEDDLLFAKKEEEIK